MRKKLLQIIHEDREARHYLCRNNISLYATYYFTHYMHHANADFHENMYSQLLFEDYDYLLWIFFRGAAKTALARIKVLHSICYKTKNNIGWVGVDESKAGLNLRSIANELQANPYIVRDFGQLFYEDKEKKAKNEKKSKPKALKEFVTENGIMLRLVSINVSQRGIIFDNFRPDFYVFDDIENEETKKSAAKTRDIINKVDEIIAGKDVSDCQFLILGNRIHHNGVITYLENKAKGNPKWRSYEQKLIENGKPSWKSKYAMTDDEADLINANITNKKKRVASIEQIKRDLGGKFDQEMMNKPQFYQGLIYPEFTANNKIDPFEPPASWKNLTIPGAIDVGATNATAVGRYAIDPDSKCIFRIGEYYKSNDTIKNHAPRIRELFDLNPDYSVDEKPLRLWADPSAFNKTMQKDDTRYSYADEYEKYGIFLVPAKNDVLLGINKCKEKFKYDKELINPITHRKGSPSFFTFTTCKAFIKEIENYAWKERKENENDPEQPIKANDHAMDESRYFIVSNYGLFSREKERPITPSEILARDIEESSKNRDEGDWI